MTEPLIIDRGRGPEIRGTRITVFDVMDYLKTGWDAAQIAAVFQLPPREIEETLAYIDAHRDEVDRQYAQILDRHRSHTTPPEVAAKLNANRERFWALVDQVRGNQQEATNAGRHVGP